MDRFHFFEKRSLRFENDNEKTKTTVFIKFIVSVMIVNVNPSLKIVNNNPSLKIVNKDHEGDRFLPLSSFKENIQKFQLPHNFLPACKMTFDKVACKTTFIIYYQWQFFSSKNVIFKKFDVSLKIVNDNPLLTIFNDDPSLTIVNIFIDDNLFSKT